MMHSLMDNLFSGLSILQTLPLIVFFIGLFDTCNLFWFFLGEVKSMLYGGFNVVTLNK